MWDIIITPGRTREEEAAHSLGDQGQGQPLRLRFPSFSDGLGRIYRGKVGNPSGDPMAAGHTIVDVAMSPRLPFRLLLGSDALAAARTELEGRLRELEALSDVSKRGTVPEGEGCVGKGFA